VQLPINSDYRNDMERHELFASKVMPLETRKRITTLIGSDRGPLILIRGREPPCRHRAGARGGGSGRGAGRAAGGAGGGYRARHPARDRARVSRLLRHAEQLAIAPASRSRRHCHAAERGDCGLRAPRRFFCICRRSALRMTRFSRRSNDCRRRTRRFISAPSTICTMPTACAVSCKRCGVISRNSVWPRRAALVARRSGRAAC
jgi:hypothetical protein